MELEGKRFTVNASSDLPRPERIPEGNEETEGPDEDEDELDDEQ